MSEGEIRETGISVIGNVSWGTPLYQSYHGKENLLDILLPYCKAGLGDSQFCMWVTSPPLTVQEAKESMKRLMPS